MECAPSVGLFKTDIRLAVPYKGVAKNPSMQPVDRSLEDLRSADGCGGEEFFPLSLIDVQHHGKAVEQDPDRIVHP
jgi:hypothetical protein